MTSQQLVQCPKCSAQVRIDRLSSHLEKVHTQPRKSQQNPCEQEGSDMNSPITSSEYKRISSIVSSWIRRKKSYFDKQTYIKTLSMMILERRHGHSFEDINAFFSGRISKQIHEERVSKLEPTYREMSSYLDVYIKKGKKGKASKGSGRPAGKSHHDVDSCQSSDSTDWYDCNSVDKRDGSKYIGYTRREYENSRFGSFPIHDNYGDESWADENPLDANW
jgi:hypothetical protein